jgi:hypothetical protein
MNLEDLLLSLHELAQREKKRDDEQNNPSPDCAD